MLLSSGMTLKNLVMLGGVLAGAAYLQNKNRRERVVGSARGALDKWKARAQELAHQVETKAHTFAETGAFSANQAVSSSAGATTRRDNGTSSSGIGSGYGGSGGIGGSGGYR